tara:strand:- start:2038 stop:2556 length:519 start_codon:yes stop_codon:yes gene_type:complete
MSYLINISESATTANIIAIHNLLVSTDDQIKTFKNKSTATDRTIAALHAAMVGASPADVAELLSVDLVDLISVVDTTPAKPANPFLTTLPTFTGNPIRARKTSNIYAQLAFITGNPTLTPAEVYEAYNRADLPDATILDPKDRPSDRPGWINNQTYVIAEQRGLVTLAHPAK